MTFGELLLRLKTELQQFIVPCPPLGPSEFQSRLQVVATTTAERAKARGVRFPDRFYLGFEDYASGLPNETAAPLLGRELAQLEWLVGCMIDAEIDSLVSFRRAPLPEEQEATASLANVLESELVEITFLSTPAAARAVLNRIANAEDRLLVVRLLRIRNEHEKGPPRDPAGEKGTAGTTLEFIVGEERIETRTTIEIVRLRL